MPYEFYIPCRSNNYRDIPSVLSKVLLSCVIQPEPEKAVAKGPIPAEHIQLQEAFDGLVAKCRGTAMNQVNQEAIAVRNVPNY